MKEIKKTGGWDIAIASIIVMATIVCNIPIMRALCISPLLFSAYFFCVVIYRKTAYYQPIGQLALSIAFVMMSIFFTLNLFQSTIRLGSIDTPFLLHDAQSFYLLSHDIHNNELSNHSPLVPYMGYPRFLSLWLSLGINDIAYPIIFNIALMLGSLLLVGKCACIISGNTVYTNKISGYAMMLTALVPGVMASGTVLSKEPFIIFSILLCTYALLTIKQHRKPFIFYALLIFSLCILSLFRATYLYIILIFAIGIWIYKFTRQDIIPGIAVVILIAVAIEYGVSHSTWGSGDYVGNYIKDNGHSMFFYGDSQKPLQQLLGDYNSYSVWKKLLILPFTVAIQFMIPFPFETALPEYGQPISNIYHRMSYLWYMAALPILLYYILHWWRKGEGTMLSIWALVTAIAYCIPAFITGGAISRYAFCFVPLLSIMGGYVLAHIHTYDKKRKQVIYMLSATYFLLIGIALYIGANPSLIIH